MGGGLSVRNNTGIEVLVTLSQVGPLHWKRIPPYRTETIDCGQVWFTVDARLIDNNGEPSDWAVAAPFVIGLGAGVLIVATAGAALAPSAGAAAGGGAAAAGTGTAGTGTAAGTGIAAGTGVAAGAAVAAEGTAVGCMSAGCVAATAGGVSTAIGGGGVIGLTQCRSAYEDKLKVLREENAKKWLSQTPSEVSAKWLADRNVIAVVPKSVGGVYADGKTIDINYTMLESEGGSRMTLDISGV